MYRCDKTLTLLASWESSQRATLEQGLLLMCGCFRLGQGVSFTCINNMLIVEITMIMHISLLRGAVIGEPGLSLAGTVPSPNARGLEGMMYVTPLTGSVVSTPLVLFVLKCFVWVL